MRVCACVYVLSIVMVCLLGAKVAEYAGKHLHKYITNRPEYKEGNIVEAMKQVNNYTVCRIHTLYMYINL